MQERFNRYTLTKEIASKPSGSVYLAHRVNNASKKVALKVFKATSFTSKLQSQNFLQTVERIRQLRHSSIVPILDLGIEQGHPYVVREYLASSSLRHRLDSLSPQRLDLQEALSIIFQVGQALCYAHEHDILHGNLKPENIFFNDDGEALLADFGLTSFTNLTKLDDQSHRQTTSYLAPEQLVGSITEKSDQYALASLAYELITGYVPFSAQSFSLVVSPISLDGAIERKENNRGDQAGLVQVENTCENNHCPDYGKVGGNTIRKFGKTRKGVQRWQCKTCQMTWSASSISAKPLRDLIPLTDLVPNLPEPIEEVVLKAMTKDPSERYADITIFLRTLQVASLLPTSSLTDSLIAAPVTPLPTSFMMPFENMQSEASLTTSLLERWKHMQNDSHASKVPATSNSDTYHPNKSTVIPNSDTYHPNKPTPIPNSSAYHPMKSVTKPKLDAYRASKDPIETLSEGKRPQPSRPLAPTLWLAFALSGIALLLGTVALYALVPSHSPGSSNHVNSNPTAQPSVQVINTPVAQPSPPIPATVVIPTPTPTPARSYEADAPQNTLSGGASVVGCPNGVCSDGKRVGYIGLNNGEVGILQFNNVSKNIGGKSTLTIYYFIAGQDKLTMYIRVNGGSAIVLNVPTTPDGNTVGTVSTTVSLNAGNNTIEFFNPSVPAPDMDRIVV